MSYEPKSARIAAAENMQQNIRNLFSDEDDDYPQIRQAFNLQLSKAVINALKIDLENFTEGFLEKFSSLDRYYFGTVNTLISEHLKNLPLSNDPVRLHRLQSVLLKVFWEDFCEYSRQHAQAPEKQHRGNDDEWRMLL